MILSVRSTSRSREQSTKRRLCSEKKQKVYRPILGEIHEVRKGVWAFFFIADWLGRQTPITRM